MKAENYDILKCEVCNTRTEAIYRNEQIESIAEQFTLRKHLTTSFLEWIKNLNVYLPAEKDD